MSRIFVLFILVILLINGFQIAAAQEPEPEKVESVEVQLNVAGQIYEGLQERIEFSIGRVGDRILLDQPISLLQKNKEVVRGTISNVFSKVLIGFKVESVDLFLGKHTKVLIHLTPIPPLISQVKLNIEITDMAPEMQGLTKEVATRVENQLNQIFVGLPVASVSWSEGIIKQVGDYLFEKEFPGFKSNFSVEAGSQTVFQAKLIPEGPTVSEVNVAFSSTNIPEWLVHYKGRDYQESLNILKGLPVEFLVHYQSRLEQYISKYLNGFAEIQRWGIRVNLLITPGIRTKVDIVLESPYYQLKLEARYFFSQNDYFGNFQSYFGYRTDSYELYSRWYWGHNPSGQFKIGVALPLEKNFTGGFEYELDHQYKDLFLHFQFDRGDYLDWRMGIDGTPNEAVVGIFLNKHANLEFANYADTFGSQLMFHF